MHEPLPPIVSAALPAMLEEAPVGVVVEDAEGRVQWINATAARQLGVDAAALHGADAAALPLEAVAGAAAEEPLYRVSGLDEEAPRLLACTRWPADGSAGPDGLRVRFLVEASRQRRLPRTGASPLLHLLKSRPGVDPASGVLDRRSVSQVLQSEVSRSRRYGNTLSVMLMRVPGGAADDGLMARAGRALKEQTRWADSIGRWSEEEFLLVLPETSSEAAAQLVSKLQANPAGEQAPLPFRSGIAQWQPGDDVNFLLERVRDALSRDPGGAPLESRNHG